MRTYFNYIAILVIFFVGHLYSQTSCNYQYTQEENARRYGQMVGFLLIMRCWGRMILFLIPGFRPGMLN